MNIKNFCFNSTVFYLVGIETRFGLAFPKYKSLTSNESSPSVSSLTSLLGVPVPQVTTPK